MARLHGVDGDGRPVFREYKGPLAIAKELFRPVTLALKFNRAGHSSTNSSSPSGMCARVQLTLFHCGLRAGEASGLFWSDLDTKNKTILVRRQFTRGQKGKPKTRKKRPVDVSTVLLAELQALKKQRQEAYLAKGKNEIPELIFLGPGQIIWEEGKPVGRAEGGHVDMDNFRNRVFWKACDKAKIRRRRVHDTRHTFASLLLSNGEPLKYVSSQLGHASIRMTADVYGHLEVGSNRAAMDRLPALHSVQSHAVNI